MRRSLFTSFQIFRRSVLLCVPYLLLVISSVLIIILQNKHGALALSSLTKSLQIGVFGFLYFTFAAYEIFSLSRQVSAEESLASIPSARQKLSLSQFITLLFPLILWSSFVMISHFIFSQSLGGGVSLYIKNAVLSILLYCFLPGLAGLFLGGVLSVRSRPVTYGIVMLATLLVSAIPLRFFSNAVVDNVALAPILDWFALSVPNAGWVADTVYGVAVETSRWFLVIFWCSFFALLLLWQHRKKSRSFFIISLAVLLLMTGSGLRFALRHQDCVLNKDDRPDGILAGEYQYYLYYPPSEPVSANFSITEYDLQLDIADYLRARATLHLSDEALSTYRFTLSRHFVIDGIENGQGDFLSFVRDGDFIIVDAPDKTRIITIEYHGSNGKYYANRQAIALPAYCSYYPLPGHQLRWDSETGSILPVIAEAPISFRVSVKSPLPVFSNLPMTDANAFEGTEMAVTLYAGIMTEKNVNGLTYLYSPLSGQSLNVDLNAVNHEIALLNDIIGLDSRIDTKWRKVVMQPFTIAVSNSLHESVIAFPDHVLLCDLDPTSEKIARELFSQKIPFVGEASTLRRLFLEYLSSDVPDYDIIKPPYNDLLILKKYNSHSEILDENEWFDYIRVENEVLTDLFLFQKKELGPKKMLSTVYRYLMESEPDINPVDFLYQLEEYVDD